MAAPRLGRAFVTRSLSEPDFLSPPPEVPGFRLLGQLGAGGMGSVYRAEQTHLQRIVAIKFLHPTPPLPTSEPDEIPPAHHVSLAQAALRGPSRESQVLAQVRHPNIVTLYDSGVIDGREYLVLEYLSGGSLRDRLAGKPWSPSEVVPIITGIGEALTAIHSRGLLHLDLKPENVLFDEHGQLKLTDFGLARTQVDAATLSDLGIVQGSLDYAALELRSGLHVDPRTDLFSLGVITYELLTGRVPGRVYQSVREANPTLRPAVDSVLQQSLARHPEDRLGRVSEFQRELVAALVQSAWLTRRAWIGLLGAIPLSGAALWWFWPSATPVAEGITDPSGSTPAAVRGTSPVIPLQRAATMTWISDPHDSEAWLGSGGLQSLRTRAGGQARLCQVGMDRPEQTTERLIPLWPGPRPVLLFDQEEQQIFFHPLLESTVARRLAWNWPDWPALVQRAGSNRLEMIAKQADDRQTCNRWFVGHSNVSIWQRGDGVSTEQVEGRPALCLWKRNTVQPDVPVVYRQRILGAGLKPGSLVMLRYRIHLETGYGRVALIPQIPLRIPVNDSSAPARRLRLLSQNEPEQGALATFFNYRLTDWILPGPRPRWYWVVWEWPPHAEGGNCQVELEYQGLGRVLITEGEAYELAPPDLPDG